jgi:hypothetical protein
LTVLLESWLGELPVELIRSDCWHRDYLVNEPVKERYGVAARVLQDKWGNDRHLTLKNLPTDEFLASLSDSSVMFMVASESLWSLKDSELKTTFKAVERVLFRNGAALMVGLVQPKDAELRNFYLNRFRGRLPSCGAVEWFIEESFKDGCGRTEEDYGLHFSLAGLQHECIAKRFPFQAWLLTRANHVAMFNYF